MSSFPRARPPPPPSATRRLKTAATKLLSRSSSSPLTIAVASLAIASALALHFFGPLDAINSGAAEMLSNIKQALSRPIINDVSTDLSDPPSFSASSGIGPMPEGNKPIIERAYPGLKPLIVPSSSSSSSSMSAAAKKKGAVFSALERLARSRGDWEVTEVNAEAGTLQGTATTRLLRFRDDFVFRVSTRAAAASSSSDADADADVVVVDARSRSRVGKGDLGANAARIEGALRDLKEALLSSSSSGAAATS